MQRSCLVKCKGWTLMVLSNRDFIFIFILLLFLYFILDMGDGFRVEN